MTFRVARRWSGDADRYFGPFTYALSPRYHCWGWALCSGDQEDYSGCSLRLHAGPHTLIGALPQWVLRPWREKVFPSSWTPEDVARMGRNWYWNSSEREFGFTITEGALHLHFGRRTHDSRTDRSKCYLLPWMQWRFVRRSFFGLDGQLIATLAERSLRGLSMEERRDLRDQEAAVADAAPTVSFAFQDFDGERLTATTKLEEREWRLGAGWFRWLALFAKPKVRRSLDIRFSGETGKRKGSWKGGTIGTGADVAPGELHGATFRRYCAERDMTFVGPALTGVDPT